jgi:hypothetical protein
MTLVVPTTTFPIEQVQPSGPTLDALDDRLFAVQVPPTRSPARARCGRRTTSR